MAGFRGAAWRVVCLGGLVAAAPALADTYLCKTPDGETIARPYPPPECKNAPMRRIRANGAVEEIGPKPTPEQVREQKEQERRQREERERRSQEMRKGYLLLEAYKSEQEIEAARNRDLAALLTRIEAAKKQLAVIDRERPRLEEETQFYVRRELPPQLKKRIEANDAQRAMLQKGIRDSEATMLRINTEYDEKARRYRELTRSGKPAENK